MMPDAIEAQGKIPVDRVQVGVRLEKRMVKVLKAIAEYHDTTLGELLEDIVLHSFEGGGANAFMPESIERIAQLKKIYGMDYDVHSNYRWADPPGASNAVVTAITTSAPTTAGSVPPTKS